MTAPNEAAVRITIGQKRAARHVIDRRADYLGDLDKLAEAIAVAVLSAEDESTRRVVVVRHPREGVYVFGPYASDATARKVVETCGLALEEGARGAVLPLIPAPKSPATKAQTAPPKRPAKAKVTA